jgi:hypothetical protein
MFPAGHVQRICVGRSLAPPQAFARVQDGYIRQTSRPVMAGELREMMLDSVRHHLVADVVADLRHPSTSRVFNLDNQKGLVPGEVGRAFVGLGRQSGRSHSRRSGAADFRPCYQGN